MMPGDATFSGVWRWMGVVFSLLVHDDVRGNVNDGRVTRQNDEESDHDRKGGNKPILNSCSKTSIGCGRGRRGRGQAYFFSSQDNIFVCRFDFAKPQMTRFPTHHH